MTDTGTKYRVPTSGDLAALGYSAGEAVALPSTLLAMLPAGPDLSSAAASGSAAPATPQPCGNTAQDGDKSTTSHAR